MAEEKAAATTEAPAQNAAPKASKPYLLIGLVVVNMLVVAGVGFMVWKGRKADEARPNLEKVIEGEHSAQAEDANKVEEIGKVYPLETFIVNLAGSKGRKVLNLGVELELQGNDVAAELDNRKAQIRDFIIIILSSKSYEEISSKEGKDALRNEIKDNINSFLSKGKITNVYFTNLIYN